MIWIKCYTLLFFLICLNSVGYTVKIEKRLLYDRTRYMIPINTGNRNDDFNGIRYRHSLIH